MLILWGIVLFIFTCATNSGFWLTGEIPFFHWLPNDPNYQDLFKLDLKLTFRYVFQKIGHFSGFAIFTVLLFRYNRSMRKSIIISVAYAVLTELLQLCFGRDGRLYDIVIDSAGILCGMFLVRIAKKVGT